MSAENKCPPQDRDEDCEEHLRLAFFDASEDEDSGRRHQKPMSTKDVETLRKRGMSA